MSKRVSNKKGKRKGVKLGRQRVRLGWRKRLRNSGIPHVPTN